jgi:hypothetical protein
MPEVDPFDVLIEETVCEALKIQVAGVAVGLVISDDIAMMLARSMAAQLAAEVPAV